MNDFIKVAASKQSLARRRLIQGVGTNDSWFHTCPRINGKQMTYPPYNVWKSMLHRCFSAKYHEEHPTYIDCKVCDEWLTFSVFEKWVLTQDWQDKEIDKDIISQGNKEYSPATCRFISHELNTLLTAHGAARGLYPMGVTWHERSKKYRARININGKEKHLGIFKTVAEAKAAFDSAKYAEIHRHALMQDDPEIKAGLLRWIVG